MSKSLKNKNLIISTSLSHETLHSYNNFFYQVKMFSKVSNTHLYINQIKLNKKILNNLYNMHNN
jgi:hypothetical protein